MYYPRVHYLCAVHISRETPPRTPANRFATIPLYIIILVGRRVASSLSPRRVPARRERRRTAELRQLQSVGRLRRRRCAAVRPRAGVDGGAEVVGLARRREARVPVRLADAERPDEPLAGRLGRPGQEQVEHRTLPAEYEEHEHAAQ